MKYNVMILASTCMIFTLTACQSTPNKFNGITGYEIESQSDDQAVLSYTMVMRDNNKVDFEKLKRACQNTLKKNFDYKIQILSVNEIINPQHQKVESQGLRLGQSRTSIGLSNTLNTYSDQNYATHQALESRPSTLQVVRYVCSAP